MRIRLRQLAALVALSAPTVIAVSTPTAHAQPQLPATASTAGSGPSKATLSRKVKSALKGNGVKHLHYRIQVAGVGTINHQSHRATAPASNEKIFTSLTLLQQVGPDFTYSTTVSGTRPIKHGVEHGNLVLDATGDPTLTGADLHTFARALHRRGLRKVTGRLVVGDTLYGHQTIVTGWKKKFVPAESGPVDAFTVDRNAWRGGKAFYADPSRANAKLWRKALGHAHIAVAGRTTVGTATPTASVFVRHESVSLAAIVDHMLTVSDAFEAEMLLREAGAIRSGHGTVGTGIAAVQHVARKLGLPLGIVHDGSGLSYAGRETPATITAWLAKAKTLPTFNAFFDGLPISCETGTLDTTQLWCGRHTTGRIHAKTGTLNGISALSGYVRTDAGHQVNFSFLASGVHDYDRLYEHWKGALRTLITKG